MAIKRSAGSGYNFEVICDWGIIFSLCALIFVLPASIAMVDSFAGLAIFIYLVKKINTILSGKAPFALKSFAPPAHFLNTPLKIWALAVFISVVFSHYPALSFAAFIGKFAKGVFLYFCAVEVLNDERRIWIFLSFFLFSASITALSGTVQHYTGKDFLKGHTIGTENSISTHRVSSSFSSANGLGVYLLPVIALAAHFLYTAIARNRSWFLGGVWALLLALLMACLCWTYSRSSWIGFLFVLFSMTWLDRRKALFAGALLLVFCFVFMPSLNQARNLSLVSDNASGTPIKNQNLLASIKPDLGDIGSGRFNYWKKAISIIRLSPVWGTGLNTYTRIIRKDPDMTTWWYAHNCYLQMAAETGLLGLGCFLWMLFVLFRDGLKYCGQIKGVWPLTFLQGTLSGLFGFLVQSLFDNTLYTVQLGVLMWMLFGFTAAVVRWGK